jgi:hypothetical protein
MQKIRDIARGGFSHRELLKMGLVLGGAGLIELAGMPTFRPYWAHADDAIPFTSSPNTPFVDPLPILQPMTSVILNPAPTKGPNPIPAASVTTPPNVVDVTGFKETNRPDHQRWEECIIPSESVVNLQPSGGAGRTARFGPECIHGRRERYRSVARKRVAVVRCYAYSGEDRRVHYLAFAALH